MVDWNSPAELATDAEAFNYLMHILTGMYIWEVCVSLPFEWSIITGKRSFRWPLIFYFLGRYSLLGALIGLVVSLHVTSGVNCQALYTVNQLLGNMAIGAASVNLSIRTIAVWGQNKWIIITIVALALGHWGVLLRGILQVKASLIPGEGCAITSTGNTILVAVYVYTMIFDFIVLCLTAIKLAFAAHGGGRSRLLTLIFTDGLIYFMIAFMSNVIATVFMVLDLNSVMNVIFDIPAAAASTVIACRAVRRLTKFSSTSPEVFRSSENSSNPVSFGRTAGHGPARGLSLNRAPRERVRINVKMDTFTVHDSSPTPRENGDAVRSTGDIEAQQDDDDIKGLAYY